MTRTMPRRAAAIWGGVAVVAVATTIGIFALGRAESAPAATGAGQAPPPPPPSAAPGAPNAPTGQVEVQTDTPTTSPNVRIVFRVLPSTITATVKWGNKKLGILKPKTSLPIERPRDSGPLDVVITSLGYLPVHTRAYTFTNSVVLVKMTPLDKKNTIYGYREELPPETDAGLPGAGLPGAGLPGAGGPDAGTIGTP